jgi:hypothetical protein
LKYLSLIPSGDTPADSDLIGLKQTKEVRTPATLTSASSIEPRTAAKYL